MKEIVEKYIESIGTKYSYEETSEIGYRTDFEILLKGLFESINVTRFDHDAKAKKFWKSILDLKKELFR